MSGTKPPSEKYLRILALITVLAFLLRASLIIYAQVHPAAFDYPDSQRYLRVAKNFAAGGGPIDSTPGRNTPWSNPIAGTDALYSLVVSAAFTFGSGIDGAVLWARILNGLYCLTSIIALAAIARRLFDERIALLSALVLAVEPLLLFFSALVLTEWAYIFFILAMTYALIRFAEERKLKWIAAFGIMAGLGTAIKSSSLWLPVIMFTLYLASCQSRERFPRRLHAGATALFLFTYGLLLVPPTFHRYLAFGEILLTRTGGGASLLEGLGPWADGGPGMDRIQFPTTPADANEVQRDRIYRSAALTWAQQHPWETIRLAIKKLSRTWSPTINAADYQSNTARIVSLASTIPIFSLGILGIWSLRRRSDVLILLLLPAVYFSLIHMVFVGSIRYRLPAMPFLILLAAVGVTGLFRVNHAKRVEGATWRK